MEFTQKYSQIFIKYSLMYSLKAVLFKLLAFVLGLEKFYTRENLFQLKSA